MLSDIPLRIAVCATPIDRASLACPLFPALQPEYRQRRGHPTLGKRKEESIMFESARGSAVIAVSDLARARSFYEGVFGLSADEVMEDAGAVMYTLGGIPLLVYVSGYAGTAKNTVFALETDDLEADMAALREKGVQFQDYDFPGLRTVDGIAELPGERSAWFADSEGNIIALNERSSS